ncbi:hypothetical protein C8R46DRAFT_1028074 [Mycena filopes]|nr:hypothetical protein C8R46DRAFT_1046401 [Mycena filopes]KAJ7180568.1 hypothetical protein C8R46DRAFT_1028074 [Mycena filopes]
MDVFPQELIDETLDHVDSPETLHACALVETRWAPRAQLRLFSYLTVETSNKALGLAGTFFDKPLLGRHVKRLHIGFPPRYGWQYRPDDVEFVAALSILVSTIPNVVELLLCGGRLPQGGVSADHASPAASMRRGRVLDFNLGDEGMQMLATIINAVGFRSLSWVNWSFPNPALIPRAPSLRSLAFISCRFGPSINSPSPGTGPMRVDLCSVYGCDDHEMLQNWMIASTTIHTLNVTGVSRWPVKEPLRTRLQSLEFVVDLDASRKRVVESELSALYHEVPQLGIYFKQAPTLLSIQAIESWILDLRLAPAQLLRLQIPLYVRGYDPPALMLRILNTMQGALAGNKSVKVIGVQQDVELDLLLTAATPDEVV